MRALTQTLAAGLLLAAAAPLASQSATPPITAAEIDGHLRFLSSDLLEGRAPATRGGRLAAEYISSQLRGAGLEPGAGGSYIQNVPIDVVVPDRASIVASASGKATARFRYPEDVVVWPGSASEQGSATGEVVFIGYGASAPEFRWDDFKGADLTGKVLLVLVNDPPAPTNEPTLFGGRAMTYYGRWTYKFEEAERRGAAAMLIVHTTEAAGYPWHTVIGSWATTQRMLPRDKSLPAPLGVRGWITDSSASALLRQAGLDLADLRRQAATREFRPVATGITVSLAVRSSVQHLQSENVVGLVRGRDPKLRDEYVAFSAHWDHFGIGPVVNGDSIYNGTLDNASGTADMLAIARAAAAGPKPRRSLLFVFVTAEEFGLLGSEYFGRNPSVPIERIVANVNVDGGNLIGRTSDLNVLGDTKSTLGPLVSEVVRPLGMRLAPDEHPERGHFYRSDHFSFAKVGVPSVSIGAGTTVIGKPAGWGAAQNEDYTAHRYHQPSDTYRPDFDLSGAVQLSNVVLRVGLRLANMPGTPQWNRDAEFSRKRVM